MDNFLLDDLMAGSWDYPSFIQPVTLPEITTAGVDVSVLRLDTLHPVVSGNKWFKLKGHLQTAFHIASASSPSPQLNSSPSSQLNASPSPQLSPPPSPLPGSPPASLLTFGGAWSNHIIATAYAAQSAAIPSIGVIRGERPPILSATLEAAISCGMHLEFISRQQYAEKDSPASLREWADRYPGVYIIPEGGAGLPGIRGSEQILRAIDTTPYSHILCAVGTGTMFMGLAAAAAPGQEIIGIPVLKGINDLSALFPNGLPALFANKSSSALPNGLPAQPPDKLSLAPRLRILPHWHFGGYARLSQELLDFMNRFHRDTGIPSDFVYTGKLFYAVMDMIRQHLFPRGSRLLVIHSGGLQGNRSLSPGVLNF
jgi:1-aminocyclopropane-1-carboxylate deaminase